MVKAKYVVPAVLVVGIVILWSLSLYLTKRTERKTVAPLNGVSSWHGERIVVGNEFAGLSDQKRNGVRIYGKVTSGALYLVSLNGKIEKIDNKRRLIELSAQGQNESIYFSDIKSVSLMNNGAPYPGEKIELTDSRVKVGLYANFSPQTNQLVIFGQ